MKLKNAFGMLEGLYFNFTVAFMPTLKAIYGSPGLLFKPRALSRIYMANLWMLYGDGIDGNAKSSKTGLITPNAHGAVLDIGAGHGHTVRYLDRARVSRYIALEPNALMHAHIRAQANAAGYHEADGTFVILACGAEETQAILAHLGQGARTQGPPVDTVISVMTLCTVPDPQRSVARLVRDVLKPGGQFLMYEHVLSKRSDVAWWQRFWAPFWAVQFDGCRLDRATDVWVRELKDSEEEGGSAWKEFRVWGEEGEDEEHFFGKAIGQFIKQ